MEYSLQQVINKLEKLFDIFNEKFFQNKLVRPVINVAHDNGSTYGWFTPYIAWKTEETGHFEINITSEHLHRPIHEVCATLIHEMVHLSNHMNQIKDVSRGNTYHNKKFKETAEQAGLLIEKHEKYGWTKTSLQDSTKEFIDGLGLDSFKLHRIGSAMAEETKPVKKSSSRKYVCPVCGISARATKEIHIMCTDCNEVMICEGEEDEG